MLGAVGKLVAAVATEAIRARAEGKWAQLLPLLGLDSKFLNPKHGPCPVCEGKDRYRFHNRSGHGDYYCNGCGAGDGFDLLMKVKRVGFKEAAEMVENFVGKCQTDAKPKAYQTSDDSLRRMWENSQEIQAGDMAGRYLASRGLQGPYPPSLAFSPHCKLVEDGEGVVSTSYPSAMLAKVVGPNGKSVAIHRTYFIPGERGSGVINKVRKVTSGAVPKGVAIRLGPVSPVLAVAEGIETALAVKAMFGVTCWSVLSASYLAGFVVPNGVEELRIYGDNDSLFAGQEAAYSLAKRIAHGKSGVKVSVDIPAKVGTDWANVLQNRV